jgi:putative transposase
MNRAVRGAKLFETPGDYLAFERILAEGVARTALPILAYCIMPNHWHLVVWPTEDLQISSCLHWVTLTHAIRWTLVRGVRGTGAVYQGPYRALPVQTEDYFLTLCRYVERNALRAGLVQRAEDWPWSSLAQRRNYRDTVPLEEWPVLQPAGWIEIVNRPQTDQELLALQTSLRRGQPIGSEDWQKQMAERFCLKTMSPPGRPRNETRSASRSNS